MKNRDLIEITLRLQRLSERDFQAIEWEMEKMRRLRMILSENQPRLPFFLEEPAGKQYAN